MSSARRGHHQGDPGADRRARAVQAALHDHLLACVREASHVLRVVELGCGSGVLSLRLAELRPDLEVVGLDQSTDMIRIAVQAAAEAGLSARVRFERAELNFLPLSDAWAPLLVGAGVLAALPAPQRLLAEVQRLLVPGGQAILVEDIPPSGTSRGRTGSLVPSLVRPGRDEEELRRLITSSPIGTAATFERQRAPEDRTFLVVTLTRPKPPERQNTSWRLS